MALTAGASAGFELVSHTQEDDVLWILGDPGVTYTEGDFVVMSNGVPILCTDVEGQVPVARVASGTVCPAATQAANPPHLMNKIIREAGDLCYVPLNPIVLAGAPIYEVTFANHADEAVTVYTSATPSITGTVALGADNDINSGIVFPHTGPGKGEVWVAADYATGTKITTLHRKPFATVTTDTEFLSLEGEGGGVGGIGFFGKVDHEDQNNIDMSDGYENGGYTIYMDVFNCIDLLQNLKVRVVPTWYFAQNLKGIIN